MKVYVNVENNKWKKYKIDFEKIANTAVSAVYKDSEVSITLVDDKQIHKLNKKYRDMDKPTNVLSFELGDDILLGDIFISLDTVKKEAIEAGISIEEHTAHMVVHGMLHLQGYDHIKESEAKVMESKEIKILKKLGYKNPYADEAIVCKCEKQSWLKKSLLFAFLGIITSFGFTPFHLWMLSLLGIGTMYYFVSKEHKKTSFWKSWLYVAPFGACYGISMFWWVLNSIYVIPELAHQFAIWTIPALLAIGLICAIILSVPFAVIHYVQRKPSQRAILFACVWTLILWGREWFLTGFPWNPISNITMNMPMVINSMSLWGAIGLSFVIVGLIAGFVEFVCNKKIFAFILFVVLMGIGCVFGYNNMKQNDNINTEDVPLIRIVQPAESAVYKMPSSREEALSQAKEKIRDLFVWATTDKSNKPDLIVFPETAYPYTVTDEEFPLARILNTNVIMGANYYNDGHLYNSMVVADKTGFVKHIYKKTHLVPFGEYRPFGDIIPTPGMLSFGDGKEVININTRFGDFVFVPAICYEIIFSDSLVPNKTTPNAIINITNDTWFGRTPGVYQHLDMVRRYAIESGLPIIRANYSGVSAFIESDGNITSLLPVGQNGSLDGFVWGAHNTVYRTLGRDLWMVIILMFSIVASISISVFQKKD
nr:apolipoprotein N-acyltransferase [Candidatus Enterousia merdequi]